ncbi:MAG: hypothetical protein A2V70_01250 [Planctomycetes bacterium RBG_13_63_9]|nr:MAG: hypothetical protein A2V70_01250 [Planctomycetes bacterium RBG_13_63_9]
MTITLKGNSSTVFTVAAPLPEAHYVATGIGMALSQTLESAGVFEGTQFWCGEQARPLSIRKREDSDAMFTEYVKLGAPQGPTPAFFGVAIDWRGEPVEMTLPPGLTQVGRTVEGEPNWPDYPAAQLAEYFKTAEAAQAVVNTWGPLGTAAQEAADKLPSFSGWKVALAIGGGLIVAGGLAVLIARAKR